MSDIRRWTVRDIPDQSGRRVVITGANSGLGYETALELVRKGADVTLAVRNLEKGEEALRKLRAAVPSARLQLEEVDLSSLKSVHAFGERMLKKNQALDLLINNAGIMAVPSRMETEDGFELQFGTNHIGHFVLTGLLWPLLLQGRETRVVTVSSLAHNGGRIRFKNLDFRKSYKRWDAYCQAKLANLLFGRELHRRCMEKNLPVKSLIVHPGVSNTNLVATGGNTGGGDLQTRFMELVVPLTSQNAASGAIPSLYAATSPEAEGGVYYGPSGIGELVGAHPKRARVALQGRNAGTAAELWAVSEQRTGVRFA